jgi:hypothetical protein
MPRSVNLSQATPREIAHAISRSRRDFLREATGAMLLGPSALRAITSSSAKKAVVVTFGGGARDDETFNPDGQDNIPHMLAELAPRSTFFTQVINRGILGHYVATASLATGVYETFNNFAAVSPGNPTVFEYFRKDLKRPATDAWVIAPSNGFNRIGESDYKGYGKGFGAGVILPKRLLAAALANGAGADFNHLLQDNYESQAFSPVIGGNDVELQQLADIFKVSVGDFITHAKSLASPDELSVYIAHQLMKRLAPSLLWITLHDIDVAHSGAFSLYLEGIRRSDRLCADLWKAIQSEPEYAGKTTLFILPDFGRDSDISAGGNGFQHHRTGDPTSRTTWMMVLGPGVRENHVVERPVDSTDLVPTLGSLLGFTPSLCKGQPLLEVL